MGQLGAQGSVRGQEGAAVALERSLRDALRPERASLGAGARLDRLVCIGGILDILNETAVRLSGFRGAAIPRDQPSTE